MLNKINKSLSNTIVMSIVIVFSLFFSYTLIKPVFTVHQENLALEAQLDHLNGVYKNDQELYTMVNDEVTQQELARQQYQLSEDTDILFRFPEDSTVNEN